MAKKLSFLLGVVALGLVGCGSGNKLENNSFVKGVGIKQDGAMKHSSSQLNVCFENHGDGDAELKPFRWAVKTFN